MSCIWWTPTHTNAAFDDDQVPEPGSMVLALVALLGLGGASRRRRG